MPAPHRILHVIDSFDLGGAQEALLNLVACADRTRFAPEVATLHGRGIYWERFRALGVPVHSLSPHKFIPLYAWNLLRLLRTRRYAIVHCHLTAANLVAKPLAALCGVRVRFCHDQANDAHRRENRLLLALESLANRLSTHVCAVSASIVDFLKAHEHVPEERISLVHNAIDLRRFTPGGAVQDAWNFPTQRAGHRRYRTTQSAKEFLTLSGDRCRSAPFASVGAFCHRRSRPGGE